MAFGGGFAPPWYPQGSATPKPAPVRFSLGTRMLERGKVTPLLLEAMLPGQSRPPENCLRASRAEGKTYPKASRFLLINPAHNIIDFTVLPTPTIL